MTKLIRILRFLFRSLGRIVLGLLLLTVIAVGYLGFTASGAALVAGKVAALVSEPGQMVAIETSSSLLGGGLRAPEITLSDSKGVYARIRNLEVDWAPTALLGFKFSAERIQAGRVEFLRPPLKEGPEKQASSTPFRLPVSIEIAKLDLPDIMVGKDIGGREFSLAASGSGRADSQDIVLSLAANRKDAPDARAIADVAYVPGENRLTLKASLDEPKDGMIASLLRLPDRPALHLTLDGAGPLSDWRGKLAAALDGSQAFTMDLGHQALADNGHRLTIEGGGQAQPLMPETVRALFAGQTDFTFDINIGQKGRIEIRRGSLASSSVQMTAAGIYDPTGDNSLTVRLAGADGPVAFAIPAGNDVARLSVRSVDLSLSGKAEAAALNARSDIEFAAFPGYRVDDVTATITSSALDLAARSGPVRFVLGFERGSFANENIQRLLPGPFRLEAPIDLDPGRLVFKDATIESARIGGTISGSYRLAEKELTSDLTLFALPQVLPETLAARTRERIGLSAHLVSMGDGAISISGLELQSELLQAKGEASLASGTVKADLSGALPKLAALLGDAKGTATYSIVASGPVAAPDFKATLSSENAVLSGRKLDSLTLVAEGNADPKAPKAKLGVEGKLGGQSISIDAEVSTEAGVISLPVLEAKVGPNQLQGALRLNPDYLPEGGLTFNLPDLGLMAALGGQKASGDLKGTARFTRTNGASGAVIDAAGKSIQRDGLSIREPRISLDIADLKSLAASGTVEAREISSGANRLSTLRLAFDRAGNKTGFDLKAGYDGKPLLLNGSAEVDNGSIRIGLKSFSAAPKGVALTLAKATEIGIDKGVVSLPGLVIQAGKGTARISGTAGQTLNLTTDINALPLSLANAVQPSLKAEGTLSGTVTIKGKSASPEIGYRLSLDKAAVAQTRGAGLQVFGIKVDGDFRQGVANLTTTAANGDGMSVKGGGAVAIAGNRGLNLAFTGKLPLKAASAMLASQGLVVGGNASLDLKISGTATQPAITGRITSSDASLLDVRRNLAIRNLAVAIDLDRTRAVISKLAGALSTGGTVSVTGSVGIQPGSNFPADLKIAFDRAAYVDGKIVSTVVDGSLTLSGPLLGNAKLGGQLTLGRSAITIPQKLPASLAQINVKHKNESAAVAAQTSDVMVRSGGGGKGSSSSIALDLVISAPRIFVQGRGIDAELGGDLTLRGTANDPIVSGGFKMTRGRLTILNRRLDFTSGMISFGGDLSPTLDMAAESDTGSTTVTVSISGPANDPSVSFSSSPALPQDEVLAQLIFNQSLSRLSVLQIAQLADAVAQLAGGRSTSLFQSLRSNLGVDDLDVTSDESGQAKVKAGKYLNDRTYIQVEQGANSGSKASINLDVGRGIKLKGEAGSDGAGAAGIFYEKEY